MTDKVVEFPPIQQPALYGTQFIGPFVEEWRVTCDGYVVPKLRAIVQEGDHIILTMDDRFMIEGSREEVSKWVPMLANALAIGAGYSCFGQNSVKDPNPFQVEMMGIGEDG